AAGAAKSAAHQPSPRALANFRQAQDLLGAGDEPGLAPDFLERALADSPGFVDAAVTLYSLNGRLPEKTAETLWADGAGLLALATQVRALGRDAAARTQTRAWLDRAVALGEPEARFERAVARAEDGDRAGAEADLLGYVGATPSPPHLDEARALRAQLS